MDRFDVTDCVLAADSFLHLKSSSNGKQTNTSHFLVEVQRLVTVNQVTETLVHIQFVGRHSHWVICLAQWKSVIYVSHSFPLRELPIFRPTWIHKILLFRVQNAVMCFMWCVAKNTSPFYKLNNWVTKSETGEERGELEVRLEMKLAKGWIHGHYKDFSWSGWGSPGRIIWVCARDNHMGLAELLCT